MVSISASRLGLFNGVLSGAGSLTKTGDGTVNIAGHINTYTGKTIVTGGTLIIDRESSLGGNPGSWVPDQLTLDSGTLEINNNTEIGFANVNLGVTLGVGGGTIITDPGVAAQIDNEITGPGSLTKTGVAQLTLKASTATGGGHSYNTYQGKTIINQGTLVVDAKNELGTGPGSFTADWLTINGGIFYVSDNVTLDANWGVTLGSNNGTNYVYAGKTLVVGSPITGAGAFAKTGPGTTVLSVANNYSGGTVLSLGTLCINNNSALGSGTFTIAGGSIDNTSSGAVKLSTYNNAQNWNADFTFNGTQNLDLGSGAVALSATRSVTVSANTLTVGGIISGSGFGLTKAGNGTMVLSGVNTYSGATLVNAGALLGVTGGSCSSSAVTVAASATNGVIITDTNAQWTCASLTYSATSSRVLFNFGNTLVPSKTLAPLKTTGNVTYTATPYVIVAAGNLPNLASPGYLLMNWVGTEIGTHPAINTANLIAPAHLAANIYYPSPNTAKTMNLTVSANVEPLVYYGTGDQTWTVGSGNIWKDSSASHNLVFYSETTIPGDSVVFSNYYSFTSPVTVTLSANINPASVICNESGSLSSYDYIISGGGSIGGATALTKAGIGKLTLSTANAYTGGTTLSGGTLVINNATALGSGTLTISGGTIDSIADTTLNLNGSAQAWNGDFTFLGNAKLNLGSGPVTLSATRSVTVNGSTLTVGGVISGSSFGLTKAGTGTLALTNASTYSGATTVSAGKLLVNGSTASGSAVTVSSSGTLAGSGTVAGTVVVNGTIAPGNNAVGTLNTGAETWNSGGTYQVEVTDTNGPAGTGWDFLNITGSLTVAATSGSQFTINLSGSPANWNPKNNYRWRIATASTGVAGFDAAKFTVNTSGFSDVQGGTFAVQLTSDGGSVQGVDLVFTRNPVRANPATYFRAWGTFTRIPIANLLANFTDADSGLGRQLVSVAPGDQGTTPVLSGDMTTGYILLAFANNNTETFNYTVQDTSALGYTAIGTMTVVVTNAFCQVNNITVDGSGHPVLQLAGVMGFSYIVDRTTDLADPNSWVPLDGTGGSPDSQVTVPTDGTSIIWTYTDTNPPSGVASYYRLRQNN
jgi:autotransporter-associated beta strand protein